MASSASLISSRIKASASRNPRIPNRSRIAMTCSTTPGSMSSGFSDMRCFPSRSVWSITDLVEASEIGHGLASRHAGDVHPWCDRDPRPSDLVMITKDPRPFRAEILRDHENRGGSGSAQPLRRLRRVKATQEADSAWTSAAVSSRSTAAAESRIVSGRDEPGIGMTTGDRASIQASVTC